METKYKYRPYKSGDEKGIVELYRLSFPDWALRKSPNEYWKWKYLETPYKSNITVAEFEDKIVGVGSSVFTRVKIGDTIYTASFGDDAATHSDHRGKGVFTNVITMNNEVPVEKSRDFHYSLVYNPVVIRGHKKRGFQIFPRSFSFLVHIGDLDKHLDNIEIKNKQIIRIGYNMIKALTRLRWREKTMDSDYKIIDTFSFDEIFDTFWDRIKTQYRFIFEKNSTYLNWRYCSKHAGNYRVRLAVSEGQVIGFIVLQIEEFNDYLIGNIVELLVLPDRQNVIGGLVSDALDFFRESNVNVVYYMNCKGHPYENYLRSLGFLDRYPRPIMFVPGYFNNIRGSYETVKNAPRDSIYFSIGDYL